MYFDEVFRSIPPELTRFARAPITSDCLVYNHFVGTALAGC